MANLFKPGANYLARSSIYIGGAVVAILLAVLLGFNEYNYIDNQTVSIHQPIPFSHKHHVGGVGLDCRYCHTSVEKEASAGIPPTETCMTCHSQLFTDAPMLKMVVDSYTKDEPLRWTRVHDLPDFVYFNHSIHVNKGVGCESCHGRVDKMPLVYKEHGLHMRWCLECHRQPENHLRPKDQVFVMGYHAENQQERGQQLKALHKVSNNLDQCGICHH